MEKNLPERAVCGGADGVVVVGEEYGGHDGLRVAGEGVAAVEEGFVG